MITVEIMEEFLREFVADLDYDIHKNLECGEDDGLDHYPDLASRWVTAMNLMITGEWWG